LPGDGALFVLATYAAVFDSAGFGAKVTGLPIMDSSLHDEPIYDPAHRSDLIRVAVF